MTEVRRLRLCPYVGLTCNFRKMEPCQDAGIDRRIDKPGDETDPHQCLSRAMDTVKALALQTERQNGLAGDARGVARVGLGSCQVRYLPLGTMRG